MLRGTTLGWALEAGSNRLWIAGWRVWLPLLAVIDGTIWRHLASLTWNPYGSLSNVAIGLWPGFPERRGVTLVGAALEGEAPFAGPAGYLAFPSLAAVLMGLWCLAAWTRDRGRKRSGRFGRTALVPLLSVLCVVLPALSWLAVWWLSRNIEGRGPDDWLMRSMNVAFMCVGLALAGSAAGLTLWGALTSGRRRTLVWLVVTCGVVTLSFAGRWAVLGWLSTFEWSKGAGTVVFAIVLRVALPLALAMALGGFGPMSLLRRWPATLGLLLMMSGVVAGGSLLASVFPATLTSSGGGGLFGVDIGSGMQQTFWLLPCVIRTAIEAGIFLLVLWLLCSLAALGEIGQPGEDGAPVDARPAQQQP